MRLWPLLMSLAALSAYAPNAPAQQVETLRIGMRDDPDILDPTFSRTYVGTVVMTALCDKLFDFDTKLNIVPVLATGYEWTDSTTLLIRLRSDVQFQNGEKFDADAAAGKKAAAHKARNTERIPYFICESLRWPRLFGQFVPFDKRNVCQG